MKLHVVFIRPNLQPQFVSNLNSISVFSHNWAPASGCYHFVWTRDGYGKKQLGFLR